MDKHGHMDHLPEAFMVLGERFQIMYANEAAAHMMSCKKEDLVGTCLWDRYPEAFRSIYGEQYQKVIDGQESVRFQVYNQRFEHWYDVLAYPCGEGIAVLFHDITELKRDVAKYKKAEMLLRESEELYRFISENSQDIISYSTPDGIIRYVSPAIRTVLGYEPEDVIGENNLDYYHEDDLKMLAEMDFQEKQVFACRFRHKDGHYVWMENSVKQIRNEQGEVEKILETCRDISERRASEEYLRRTEKLTMAGQLAAGIAHEIRNPLTAIKGFLDMMLQGQKLKDEYLGIMKSEINRIEAILNELLMLAKPQDMKVQDKNLQDILLQVVLLLETEAHMKNVTITTRLEEPSLIIKCDENQIKQVFINFIKNAIEAMPAGGEIVVSTQSFEGYAMIQVSDQGHGIALEMMEKVGQPFYTTKERGTGLGLAVSFTIIENHQGKVTVTSEVDKGTTFLVKLPLVETAIQ
ncbi:PAS domain S-box protein [Brevibacillus migulae]|uniref:PAS domain S-box protein n=1 Tax=Brevibacillus migulae TaxID=1644114 RepID=UPI0014301966|nr:PAS domain S-box protein [Brevibacillus migulae]